MLLPRAARWVTRNSTVQVQTRAKNARCRHVQQTAERRARHRDASRSIQAMEIDMETHFHCAKGLELRQLDLAWLTGLGSFVARATVQHPGCRFLT